MSLVPIADYRQTAVDWVQLPIDAPFTLDPRPAFSHSSFNYANQVASQDVRATQIDALDTTPEPASNST